MKNHDLRRRARLVTTMLCFAIAGCRPPTPSEVQGTYFRDTENFSEKLVLKPDGSFIQTFSWIGKFIGGSEGTWELRHRAVHLTGYIHVGEDEKIGATRSPGNLSFEAWSGGLFREDGIRLKRKK